MNAVQDEATTPIMTIHVQRRAALGVLSALAVGLMLSGCGPSTPTSGDLYAQLPIVLGSEVDPVESITELFSRSDLVVIGTVTKVEVVDLGESRPAADEAPNLVVQEFRTEITIQPRGGGEPVVVGLWGESGGEQGQQVRDAITHASLPTGLAVFALQGPVDDWGYFCVSAQVYWCPLEVVDGTWHSPRQPDSDTGMAKDPVQPGTNVGDVIDALAETYGFEVRGH